MFITGDRSRPVTPVRDSSLHSMISAASNAPVDLRRDLDAGDVGKRLQEHRRDRVGDDVGLLADRAQRQRHRHRRSDRVAVGPLMRRDDEALAAADDVDAARRAASS